MEIEGHLLQGNDIVRIPCPKNNKKFAAGQPDTIIIHYTAGRSAESSAEFPDSAPPREEMKVEGPTGDGGF